jgi:hypothetical protein
MFNIRARWEVGRRAEFEKFCLIGGHKLFVFSFLYPFLSFSKKLHPSFTPHHLKLSFEQPLHPIEHCLG